MTLAAATVAFLPIRAQAQGTGFFTQPFQFTDSRGTGTLTVYPLSSGSTRLSYQPVQVTLVQQNFTSSGSGVYHSFQDDGVGLPPNALLSFSLVDATGSSRFYQGTLQQTSLGVNGQGTSWPTLSPQSAIPWTCQSISSSGGGNPIVDSTPALANGWSQTNFAEAIGGKYYATYNTFSTAVSTATWSGSLPPGQQNYRIEVFIPRQPTGGAPRTGNANYQITEAQGRSLAYRANQQVSVSQWIPIGSAVLNGSYRITLTDATGEPSSTRSVIANAVRLTPIP
jgi:hypothetical protein